MFDKILSKASCNITEKSSTSDVWQGFEFASNYLQRPPAISYFSKTVGYLFTKFD